MTEKAIAIIPARMGSSRFPAKPLALLAGEPVIVHTCRAASGARAIGRVVVATDSPAIAEAVVREGFEAVVTTEIHENGTSRCLEAWRAIGCPDRVIVNLQGDEPLIDPATITTLAETVASRGEVDIATAFFPIAGKETLADPDIVKVVMDNDGFALYFSRSAIPYPGNSGFAHIGTYAFRPDRMERWCSAPATPLEMSERLEQLRWLQRGCRIHCSPAKPTIGIDTPDDLRRAEAAIALLDTH